MTAEESVQYMEPTALVDTISHTWEMGSENDNEGYALRACWEALVTSVGFTEAYEMVESGISGSMADFLEVVS